MPRYTCDMAGAWLADDDIIPAGIVANLPPNSGRHFFFKINMEFKNSNIINHSDDHHDTNSNTTRIVKCLCIPADAVTMGLPQYSLNFIRNLLCEMGAPADALPEAMFQLICAAIVMMKDPANSGRLVLPIEALICNVAEDE